MPKNASRCDTLPDVEAQGQELNRVSPDLYSMTAAQELFEDILDYNSKYETRL